MAERIFITNYIHGKWGLDVVTTEYGAPEGLNGEWVPTGRNIGGYDLGVAHVIASSLESKDLCVFGFVPKVSEGNRDRFRRALIKAVEEKRSNESV